MQQLVLGTTNRKKALELQALLVGLPLQVKTLADFPPVLEIVEDGDSFAANARLKAIGQARHLRLWVLAEDSGICVAALQGAPGIFSARFAGPAANDEANNQLVLEKLRGLPRTQRGAHYHCHITLADPQGAVVAETSGDCHGVLRETPQGTAGFGYDPLFEIAEYHQTFAELGVAVKGAISHRSRALRQMLLILRNLVQAERLVSAST